MELTLNKYTVYMRYSADYRTVRDTKIVTEDRGAALAMFAKRVDIQTHDGAEIEAVLKYGDLEIAVHDFAAGENSGNNWRGKIDRIPWPIDKRKKMESGRTVNVYLGELSLMRARALGQGNISAGIRRALEHAETCTVKVSHE